MLHEQFAPIVRSDDCLFSAMRNSRICRSATQYVRPPSPRSHPCITPSDLHAHLTSSTPSPLLLPGLIRHWPALLDWKVTKGLGNLRSPDVEDKLVDVELGGKGKSYMDPDHRRVQMPLGESCFVDIYSNFAIELTI